MTMVIETVGHTEDELAEYWMWCGACELTGGPFVQDEASKLAGIHDQVHHYGSRTAETI